MKLLILMGLFITFACSVLLEKALLHENLKGISAQPEAVDLQVNLK